MSLVRRKPRIAARAKLVDPTVACDAPGVDHVEIDYDPAVWVRCPTSGEDRTGWVERTLAAYAEDLRLSSDSDKYLGTEAGLNAIADSELDAMVTYVALTGPRSNVTSTIRVLDDERMLLEFGEPDVFLTFANDPSRPPATPKSFLDKFQYVSRSGFNDGGRLVSVQHDYRALETNPALHLAGSAVYDRARDSALPLTLFQQVQVHLTDGRAL